MNCKEVELALERDTLFLLPAPAQAHLVECSTCRTLVEDLSAIISAARELPAEVEPPARLWVSLRAQLESEGVIREPAAAEKSSWLDALWELFRSRALATAAVGIVLLAAAYIEVQLGPEPPALTGPHTALPALSPQDVASILSRQTTTIASLVPAGSAITPVDVSLRENLQIVDKFIADCEKRVSEEPQDDLAREYLNGAYQQKAELLAVMMERGGGGN